LNATVFLSSNKQRQSTKGYQLAPTVHRVM